MNQGILYIVSAPSGTGKSSLIQAVLKNQSVYETQVSISYTTREIRSSEKNGEHYYFITKKKFQQMIKNNDFLEYACIFGNYYGTSYSAVRKIINSSINLILDIDWQGAQQIRQKIPLVRTIFILPPSKDELLRRLRDRGEDSEKIINQRIVHAIAEIKHHHEYDYIIINDNFNNALGDLKSIIRSENLRSEKQIKEYNTLINKLLTN